MTLLTNFKKIIALGVATLSLAMPLQYYTNLSILYASSDFQIYEYENVEIYPQGADALQLDSGLAILMDASSGFVIYGMGIHERAYPASMTKVMTALLLLESGHDLDDRIYHSAYAVNSIWPGSSHIAMNPGDTLSVQEALYAIMLPSANDVSNAVAEFVAGTTHDFAVMMTQRAHELGAVNTNFTNAHGLPYDDHYTTPYDMALIMREAIKHPAFLQAISTQRYYIPPTEHQENVRPMQNTNRMIFPSDAVYNADIVGGKTGWTTPSRHTLVSYAQNRDRGLITVVMSADSRGVIFNDTNILMEHGFDNFEEIQLFLGQNFGTRDVQLIQRSGTEAVVIGQVQAYTPEDVVLSLPRGLDVNEIYMRVSLPDRLVAPVNQGFVLGRIDLEYNGIVLATIPLLALDSVAALNYEELSALLPTFGGMSDYINNLLDTEIDIAVLSLMLSIIIVTLVVIVFMVIVIKYIRFVKKRKRKYNFKYTKRRYNNISAMKDYRYRN